jgi:mono/diheme cytochrome c family protein
LRGLPGAISGGQELKSEIVNRRNSRRGLSILAICVAALLFVDCASRGAKTDEDERVDRRREKIGAEDFMPEQARVIYARSCASCHGPDGHGVTAVAPDIYRARYRTSEEWEKYLRDSADAHPVSHPPPLWLNKEEMKNMAEYLESATRQNQ